MSSSRDTLSLRQLSVLVLVCLLLAACTESQRLSIWQNAKYYAGRNTYLATIYPDKYNLTVSRDLGWFTSLEGCRGAALKELDLLHSPYPAVGDYECGLNCGTLSDWPGWVCLETLH